MSSHNRPAERGYHQDYIARIRYENNLPPPPGAPKLLNIPIEGLNYYTSAAFASRLARQQPLNIEADADLGMPIDLVGVPGVFDGDESAIQAPLTLPPTHPKDKPLLRPLSELGKPKFTTGAHSFLRRTEYISGDAKARAEASANAAKGIPKSPTAKPSRRQTDLAKEDPINILRHAIKGFDIANPESIYKGKEDTHHLQGAEPTPAELEAWNRPRHPTKPELKLLDSYPILPDLDAMPDQGAFIITKFAGNPTNATTERDTRMDVALLNPMEKEGDEYDYELYLPQDEGTAKSVKRKFDLIDQDGAQNGADSAESPDGEPSYKYLHHRTYDMGRQINSLDQPYKEVALALHDPALDQGAGKSDGISRLSKGAYYYPIGIKMQLKPKRNKNLANLGLKKKSLEEEVERPDEIDLVVRSADAEEIEKRQGHRDELVLEGPIANEVAVAG